MSLVSIIVPIYNVEQYLRKCIDSIINQIAISDDEYEELLQYVRDKVKNSYVQNIIIIFSGLFIGQNAISSGLVGSTLLLIASLSYVSSFAITNNQHLITSFDIFRLYNLILSYTFGILGFTIGLITTLLYISSQKSVGVPFFLPFSPLRPNKLKGFFFPKHGDKNE